ncbi:hypothetical protein D3C71_1204570 [compost metagenome]
MDADAYGGLAVQACSRGIGLSAQLDTRHVLDADRGAIGIGAQHDVAELLHAGELSVDHHGGCDALARHIGQVADGAAGHLRVLRTDGGCDLGRREVEAHHLGRVDPDAHGTLGTEQLSLANAFQALQFGHHVARCVVAQGHRVRGRIGGREHGEQQEVGARLVHAHALLGHCGRQAWRCA